MSRYPTRWFASVAAVAVALAAALWWVGTLDRSRVSAASGRPAASVAPAPAPAPAPALAPAPARSGMAVDVLHRWDLARSRAYSTGDVEGLRSLYVAGSSAGTTDARMLRAYERRGLRVEGISMQLLEVVVLAHAPGRWRLRVTDRLTGAVAVRKTRPAAEGPRAEGPGAEWDRPEGDRPEGDRPEVDRADGDRAEGDEARLPLPRDEASTRTVTLRLRAGSWKVASVR